MDRRRLPTRAVAVASVVCFAVVAVVLSLSERAPGLYREVRHTVMSLGGRLQTRVGVELARRDDIPISAAFFGHVVLWFVGAVVVGWATRRRVDRVVLGLVLVGAGAMLELLQALVTETRQLDVADVVANTVGVVSGLLVVTALDSRATRSRTNS